MNVCELLWGVERVALFFHFTQNSSSSSFTFHTHNSKQCETTTRIEWMWMEQCYPTEYDEKQRKRGMVLCVSTEWQTDDLFNQRKNETTHICVVHFRQKCSIKTQQILDGDREKNGINQIATSATRDLLWWRCFGKEGLMMERERRGRTNCYWNKYWWLSWKCGDLFYSMCDEWEKGIMRWWRIRYFFCCWESCCDVFNLVYEEKETFPISLLFPNEEERLRWFVFWMTETNNYTINTSSSLQRWV